MNRKRKSKAELEMLPFVRYADVTGTEAVGARGSGAGRAHALARLVELLVTLERGGTQAEAVTVLGLLPPRVAPVMLFGSEECAVRV
jgi:hypothetical protein